ncbi:MAG: hypothetical protein ISS78_05715 [Phycisphaerae bacterium]|nr:hypothetical protein [Phycisphaerae bacterium]
MAAVAVGAETVTLKNRETGETVTGQLLDQRVNNLQVFETQAEDTRFLDMNEWVVLKPPQEAGKTDEPGTSTSSPQRPPTTETPGKLMTRGEVLADLFKRYQSLRAQHEAYLKQRKASNERVSDATKSLSEITAEYNQNKQAVERVLNAAKASRTVALRVLSMPPPARPRLQSMPSRPNPAYYTSVYEYNRALDDWASECARVRQYNELLMREYEASLRQYEVLCQQAAQNVRDANEKIAECERLLKALLEARQEAEQPLKTERHDLTEGTRASEVQARKLVQDLEAVTGAIREMPEKIRLEQGIIEWRGDFYSLAEVEQLHAALMKEIEASRGGAGPLAGLGLDATDSAFRHPKQNEADALKTLIEQAKAAQAGSAVR